MTAVFLASHLPLLLGDAVPRRDAGRFFAPAQILVADAARAGTLLRWNPWTAAGSPDFADPQTGAFSPLNVLLGLIFGGSLRGFVVYWMVIWWLGGIGMVALSRHLGAPPWSAALVAMGFLAAGSYVGHAQHTAYHVSFSALPFLVWRFDVALRSGRRLPAVQTGAICGLSALSGYPALTILNGCFLALWALGRIATHDFATSRHGETSFGPRLRSGIVALLITGAVAVVILSPGWAAFFVEGGGYTDRVGELPRAMAVGSNALHPGALATFSSPYPAVLAVLNPELWSSTDPSSTNVYVPVAVVVLALAALAGGPLRNRSGLWPLYLGFLAVLALGLAMGNTLPFRGWLYDLFPPSRYFRHAAMFRAFYIFSLCVLASYTARELAGSAPAAVARLWHRLRSVSWGAALMAGIALVYVALSVEKAGHLALAAVAAAGLWAGTALLVSLGPRIMARGVNLLWLLTLLTAVDAWSAVRLSRYFVLAHDAASVNLWRRAEAEHRPSLDLKTTRLDRVARSRYGVGTSNLNVLPKEPVLASYQAFNNSIYKLWIQEPLLISAATGKERFWFSKETAVIPWTREVFVAFRTRCRAIAAMPIVLHSRDEVIGARTRRAAMADGAPGDGIASLPAALPATVDVIDYRPNLLEIEVDAPDAGYLLVTDRFARGWRARVDGAPTEVVPANFLFRAIAVPRGRARIELSYHPFGFPWLLILSWTTLLFALAATLGVAVRRRSQNHPPAGETPREVMRRTGDTVLIDGAYQHRALRSGSAVQRFWHQCKHWTIDECLPPASGDTVLDVGCGSGTVSAHLAAAGAEVLAVDGNTDAIAFARRTYTSANLEFRQALVDDALAGEPKKDKIYCLEVVEHIFFEQGEKMLQVFFEMLKPGGSVFLTTPNYRSAWPLIEAALDRFRLAPQMGGSQHVQHYHRSKLVGLCSGCGFEVVRTGTMCFVAPWLAPISWRLAERLHRRELTMPVHVGAILFVVLRKPLSEEEIR